jgi:predicted phosphodiesterase
MRIVVMTDVHANLPALEAALAAVRAEGCDAIFHTGDAIAIGPHPAECLDLLLRTPHVHLVRGNHEAWFVEGLPEPQPVWMSDGEVEHQRWTHAQLEPHLRSVLGEWPWVLERDFEGVSVVFTHYGLDSSGEGFHPLVRDATAQDLDSMFGSYEAELLFYGHHHVASDLQGRARYVNPGSLGCYHRATARYCVVELRRGRYTVEHRAVPYHDRELFDAFEQRDVPERAFIYRAFLGGRFGIPSSA